MRFFPLAFLLGSLAVALAGWGYFRQVNPDTPINEFVGGEVYSSAMSETLPEPLSRYWIGVSCDCLNEELKTHLVTAEGLLVRDVLPNSPADRAGLETHDVILAIDGSPISCCKILSALIDRAGESELRVEFVHAGQRRTVQVVPEPRPQCDVLVSPLVIPNNSSALQGLREFDFGNDCNPLTGEMSLVVLGTGVVLSVDPAGRVQEVADDNLPWSVDQMNRLAIPYDWQSLSELDMPSVLEIVTLAVDSANGELVRLERDLQRCLDEENVVQGQVEALQAEADRVRHYAAGLKRLADSLAKQVEAAAGKPATESGAIPRSGEEGRGPRDHKFLEVAGV